MVKVNSNNLAYRPGLDGVRALAVAGVILYPLRDLVSFWCRWFAVSAPSAVLYPIKITGGIAMFAALLLALVVFVQGARQQDVR